MSVPTAFSPSKLMARLRHLCKDLPPRQPTSDGERQAAEYVRGALVDLGIRDVVVQPFKGISTLGLPGGIAALIALAGFPLGWFAGEAGKWLGGILLIVGAHSIFRLYALIPVFYKKWIETRPSQNIIASIQPSGEIRQRLYLLGHLDAQKQRFLMPPDNPALMKPSQTAVIVVAWLAGISLWLEALTPWNLFWFQALAALLLLGTLFLLLADERQPTVEGANDNASAVAVLLSVAEAIQAQPLEKTEVHFLFTGCEEVGHQGLQAYLREYQPQAASAYWLDLELVGCGQLAYASRHGVTYLTTYRPSPVMVRLVEETAAAHPESGVAGRDMLVFEEVGTLRLSGYDAICLVGVDEKGQLPHWHRITDTLENIDPAALQRTAQFTWAVIHHLDRRFDPRPTDA
ncbi:MAG: Zn-dependent exopeptidase M28 [Chloroflexi bacterium]|nr:Zn-dependent exopeptidase M28 [Chloroflexota bacterium]